MARYPWEKWAVFLHLSNNLVKEFNGPARISGSAGTGKTIVALHRAVHLARKDLMHVFYNYIFRSFGAISCRKYAFFVHLLQG